MLTTEINKLPILSVKMFRVDECLLRLLSTTGLIGPLLRVSSKCPL